MLKQRFVDKGYSGDVLDLELQRVLSLDRSSLVVAKPKRVQDDSFKYAMITSYSTQHRQVKNIIDKHWDILRNDSVLRPVLPE